jgi:hypothetical protein
MALAALFSFGLYGRRGFLGVVLCSLGYCFSGFVFVVFAWAQALSPRNGSQLELRIRAKIRNEVAWLRFGSCMRSSKMDVRVRGMGCVEERGKRKGSESS